MHSFLRPHWLAAAALVAAVLTACGGGNSPSPEEPQVSFTQHNGDNSPLSEDPLASFTQQKLEWRACDLAFLGEDLWKEGEKDFTQLGERAQCALMRAPLDYANPTLGELQVALSRVAAEQPQQRMGAILFNPGGPGEDGLLCAAEYGQEWSETDPANPSSEQLKEISNRYDLIGFSPRGVGASTTLNCLPSESMENGPIQDFDDSSHSLQEQESEVWQACLDNPLSSHIHTDAMARDMDLVREVLGDAKLNYIGYSYGTWLGAWYASLFPERVGRMLLDSSVNIVGNYDANDLLNAPAQQRLLDSVLLPYASRTAKFVYPGSDPSQISSKLQELSPPLKRAMFEYIAHADGADSAAWSMNAAIGVQDLLRLNPTANEEQMLAAINTHVFTPSSVDNPKVVESARELNRALFEEVQANEAAHRCVICNDTVSSRGTQYWRETVQKNADFYPLGELMPDDWLCLGWPKPTRPRTPVARAGTAAPLLMVHSRYDVTTSMEGAQTTLDALPNASMIVVENEYKHAVFPYGQKCVDGQVADYFLHGTVPPRLSSCEGGQR